MGPKIESALRFLREGGSRVLITSPDLLHRGFLGEAGTHLYASLPPQGDQQ
jgi:carbamate kinase